MANILEYKGYIATVEYSSEDKVFFGKIEMISDLVTFECENALELEDIFKSRVDDYLETCRKLNREPQKSFKGVFNIRINPTLHKQLYTRALKEGKSLNALISSLLERDIVVAQ